MIDDDRLSREAWDSSTSAKAYNPGWWDSLTPETEPGLWAEMRSIFEEEKAISEIPEWASEIVVRMMEFPMCGYYAVEWPGICTRIGG